MVSKIAYLKPHYNWKLRVPCSSGARHRGAPNSVLAAAGSDGVDGADLAMLVQERVALVALWTARGLRPFSPKVTHFWIRGAPAIKETMVEYT